MKTIKTIAIVTLVTWFFSALILVAASKEYDRKCEHEWHCGV